MTDEERRVAEERVVEKARKALLQAVRLSHGEVEDGYEAEAVLEAVRYFDALEALHLALRALMPTAGTKLRVEAKRAIRKVLEEAQEE